MSESRKSIDGARYLRAVGRNLRIARTLSGLSLTEVEAKLGQGWRVSTISSWERGDRAGTCEKMERLAKVYGFKLVDLLPGSTDGLVAAAKQAGADPDVAAAYQGLMKKISRPSGS